MNATDDFVIKQIPRDVRIRNATTILFLTLGISALFLSYLHSQQRLGWVVLWLLPFLVIGLWRSHWYWTTTEVKELTSEASERKLRVEAEILKREEEFRERWYYRYPMAGLLLWVAWDSFTTRPDLWWASIMVAMGAGLLARELSWVLAVIGIFVLSSV